ncbi:hypothetical protein K239x_24710 [Planctomycetes bacterium K23_9]|uniref:Uncharacterized protein n=1 Tax=Stieleria marina TaxID=1930275 RepID=A0A517NTQ9_9BACT|nr:hypothetical protein K239x_24710 [Planctomycetes bacterium K23_9]
MAKQSILQGHRQNGRNHGERANDLQADEKTDHPFSRAFHGYAWYPGGR